MHRLYYSHLCARVYWPENNFRLNYFNSRRNFGNFVAASSRLFALHFAKLHDRAAACIFGTMEMKIWRRLDLASAKSLWFSRNSKFKFKGKL